MHTLMFLEPGHFHAALMLKQPNPRINARVHVYARPGAEHDAFVDLITQFNERPDNPTGWELESHLSDDPIRALMDEQPGNIAILAGRNNTKLRQIQTLYEAGINILADKPWLTNPADTTILDALAAAQNSPNGSPGNIFMDSMTERYDTMIRLRRRLVGTESIFGTFRVRDPEDPDFEPAIEIGSTHHLLKKVNGKVNRRPSWYFDVSVQGTGLVDIQSHMVDQAQGMVGTTNQFRFESDVSDIRSKLWSTRVSRSLFESITGQSDFQQDLLGDVVDEALHLRCNGQIDYRLRDVPVRQTALWEPVEADNGGDLHFSTVRGTRCQLQIQSGPETGFKPDLRLKPRDGFEASALWDAIDEWRYDFPGLTLEPVGDEWRIAVPLGTRTTHESHFPWVLDEFLTYIDAGRLPVTLTNRIRTRYRVLAAAQVAADVAT